MQIKCADASAAKSLSENAYVPSNMQNFLDAVNKLMVIAGLAATGEGALGLLEKKEAASQVETIC